MSRIRIRHTTGYRYEQPAVASYNESRMLPSTSDGQFVIYSNLDIRPNTSVNSYEDYWGTTVVSFDVLAPHTELQLTATSLVEVRPRLTGGRDLSWEQLEKVAQRATQYVEQLGQTPRTRPTDDLMRTAREIADASETPGAAAAAIARMVGDEMEYMSGVTHVHTLASEAWPTARASARTSRTSRSAPCGVSASRALRLGLPASAPERADRRDDPRRVARVGRVVHGRVERVGPDEPHRHRRAPCEGGLGRDYNDVPPLRGVYAGAGKSQLFVSVEITKES